jgi:hypothetical protein
LADHTNKQKKKKKKRKTFTAKEAVVFVILFVCLFVCDLREKKRESVWFAFDFVACFC